MQLKVCVYKEEGWYIAECPALPGCMSQGKTQEEALENIKDAIVSWIYAEEKKAQERKTKSKEKAPRKQRHVVTV
jgi:predicted RNase H-like HicB family nuclease